MLSNCCILLTITVLPILTKNQESETERFDLLYKRLIWYTKKHKIQGFAREGRFLSTGVRRHCTDWYKIWALRDHEIYYIKIELDLRKFSIGPFSETEKGFGVNPTPGGSQCTGLSPTLSWKWPRATLSPSFGPFFERNHSFGVKMVSENVWKTFKSCKSSAIFYMYGRKYFILFYVRRTGEGPQANKIPRRPSSTIGATWVLVSWTATSRTKRRQSSTQRGKLWSDASKSGPWNPPGLLF